MYTDLSVTEVIDVLSKSLTFPEYHLCVHPGQKLDSCLFMPFSSAVGKKNQMTKSEKQLRGWDKDSLINERKRGEKW